MSWTCARRRARGLVFGLSLGLASSLVALVGCGDAEPPVFRLRVTAIDSHGGPSLGEDRVRAILRRSLEHAPSFMPAERDQRSGGRKDTLVATFEYRELPDAVDQGRDLLVRMSIDPPAALADRLGREQLDVTVLLERKAGASDLASDLQLASDRLAAVLQARTDLALRTPGAVERLLGSGDADLVIPTLEWIRDHGDTSEARAAADRVTALISHDDEDIGLLAIEVIGQIGGPEHVPGLLEKVRLADTPQVNRAYDALARLGGPEARGFLQFAARNEDDPGRRAAAERALQRVDDSPSPPRRTARLSNRGHR
jgi:hypothetical protein